MSHHSSAMRAAPGPRASRVEVGLEQTDAAATKRSGKDRRDRPLVHPATGSDLEIRRLNLAGISEFIPSDFDDARNV
jgi:hypothetical protein